MNKHEMIVLNGVLIRSNQDCNELFYTRWDEYRPKGYPEWYTITACGWYNQNENQIMKDIMKKQDKLSSKLSKMRSMIHSYEDSMREHLINREKRNRYADRIQELEEKIEIVRIEMRSNSKIYRTFLM